MTEYLNYWRPERFQLAFPGGQGIVKSIAAARYRHLVPGDVIWLFTRGGADAPMLTGRLEVASHPREVAIPKYAYGNSRHRVHQAVSVSAGSALRRIPVEWPQMKALRFASSNDRIRAEGMRVFEGELASMRALTPASSALIASWWKAAPSISSDGIVAAAFGDLETNREIERAAVDFVTDHYEKRKWHVRSREDDGVGYDLECTKGSDKEFVEVKGRRGAVQQVIMTHGELREARSRKGYMLCIVTTALAKPKIHFYAGKQLTSLFEFRCLAQQLTLKRP